MSKDKPICGVCGREKESYTIFVNNSALNMAQYQIQNEAHDELCEWCRTYNSLTGVWKFATKEEMVQALQANYFAKRIWKMFEDEGDWPGYKQICKEAVEEEMSCDEFVESILRQTKQHPHKINPEDRKQCIECDRLVITDRQHGVIDDGWYICSCGHHIERVADGQ